MVGSHPSALATELPPADAPPSVSGALVDKRTFFAVGEKAQARKAARQARATRSFASLWFCAVLFVVFVVVSNVFVDIVENMFKLCDVLRNFVRFLRMKYRFDDMFDVCYPLMVIIFQ